MGDWVLPITGTLIVPHNLPTLRQKPLLRTRALVASYLCTQSQLVNGVLSLRILSQKPVVVLLSKRVTYVNFLFHVLVNHVVKYKVEINHTH